MPQKTTPCGKYTYYSNGIKGSAEDVIKMGEFCRNGCKEVACLLIVKQVQIDSGLRNLKKSIDLLAEYVDMSEARKLYQSIDNRKKELAGRIK